MIVRILNMFGLFTRKQVIKRVDKLVSESIGIYDKQKELLENAKNEFEKRLAKNEIAILTFISRAENYADSTGDTELKKMIEKWSDEFTDFRRFK